jgi:hypothetical protein
MAMAVRLMPGGNAGPAGDLSDGSLRLFIPSSEENSHRNIFQNHEAQSFRKMASW